MPIEPGMPEAVLRESDEVFQLADGRVARGNEIVMTEDQFEQIRQGYRCIACLHAPQPQPFPQHCVEPYCRFPMRDQQADELARQMRGRTDLWPNRGGGDPERERWQPSSGIWVPG